MTHNTNDNELIRLVTKLDAVNANTAKFADVSPSCLNAKAERSLFAQIVIEQDAQGIIDLPDDAYRAIVAQVEYK